jgi:catechol 2,3-dioxygenase-like lactoylglutathione lyase family enzyme
MKDVPGGFCGAKPHLLVVVGLLGLLAACASEPAEDAGDETVAVQASIDVPDLHHAMLNTIDPDAAIEWYLKVWPAASRTEVAGYPAVEGDIYVLFNRVDSPPPGAFNEALGRAEAQSAFWHIGANTNTTHLRERLAAVGVDHLPLYTSRDDVEGVWRSGLAPYAGIRTEAQIADADAVEPQDGGFSYVLAPDGALFEIAGGPDRQDSFAHVHFYHEQPLCAANWYVEHLGMELPPLRDESGVESPRPLYDPCDVETAEAGWPSLESVGTLRGPRGAVRFGNGGMSWYPRQCVEGRCGVDQPLVPSRGQVYDHVAFTVENLDAWFARLTAEEVTILEEPHTFGGTRAFMIEDLDGLAVELVEAAAATMAGDAP